jgi:hypothetical protein
MHQPKALSTLDNWAASSSIPCNCGRDTVQIYYCNVETCPDREQKFFCMECSSEDLKHLHKKVQIKQELETKMKEWEAVVTNFNQLKQITESHYP